MRPFRRAAAVLVGALLLPSLSHARDFGVMLPSIHEGKWTSSVLYEHLKVQEDFDSRGTADFTSQVVGSQFSYGLTDVLALALKGGVLIDPKEETQGSQWKGRAGYLYGIDLYNEVFPATGYRPGVQASIGATGFMTPFNQIVDQSGTQLDRSEDDRNRLSRLRALVDEGGNRVPALRRRSIVRPVGELAR